jgi:CDP-glucose 4,6-dehydratase
VNPFWTDKHILLTGHTGFKGAWAALWLTRMGARVTALALPPQSEPSLYSHLKPHLQLQSHYGDIQDRQTVHHVVEGQSFDMVLHMAAQPLVRASYDNPVETFATNIMGTVHLLEALRHCEHLKAILVVTTDKVYENSDKPYAFQESDPLGGHDPYAASKAACEMITASYARSFFAGKGVKVATARGGNVIGGGDFSDDRLVPDIWRALHHQKTLHLRHPEATRPWQHVLDCLNGYFLYLQALYEGQDVTLSLNFGPSPQAPVFSVSALAARLQQALGQTPEWDLSENPDQQGKHEMTHLQLDTRLARNSLQWQDRLEGLRAIEWTAQWYGAFEQGSDAIALCSDQLTDFGAFGRP